MSLPIAAQPRFVVESRTLHDQRVAVPAPRRKSHPARCRVGLQLAAIRVNHAIGEIVVQDCDERRRLHDAFPPGSSVSLGTARETLIRRSFLPVFLLTLTHEVVDPWLCVGGIGKGFGNRPVPDAGEIDLAVGSARRGRLEIRLAVGCTWNARGLPIQPLRAGRDRSRDQNERHEKRPHIALRFRRGKPPPFDAGW